jgi:hypothetical protein
VLLNLSSHQHKIKIETEEVTGLYTDVLESVKLDFSREKIISMGPWDYLVLEK